MRLRDWLITPAQPGDEAAGAWAPPVAAQEAAGAWAPPVASEALAATPPACAAVIGRPGEAEPVAAGLALALRGRAPAAAVIVVGERVVSGGDGGTRAARRLAARLEAHGFDSAARGRLAWAYAEPEAAGRAARVAEIAVLAITIPLDSMLELAVGEADLAVVVARDEAGPLAQIATASLACRVITTTQPLPRGLARLLASHGLRAPAGIRHVLPARPGVG